MTPIFRIPVLAWLAVCVSASADDTARGAGGTRVDPSTMRGKIMVGYQGWFNCEGDGADLGWTHWARNRNQPVGPGNVTVDLWPDVSEYDSDELYETEFQHRDGSRARVFSSFHRKTVLRHFRWMRDYGIDGAFVQRFASGLADPKKRRHKDRVLESARDGARQAGRVFAVMYDLSGLQSGQVDRVRKDWAVLRGEKRICNSPGYLHHRDRPLVAVWGIGFDDDRDYSLAECDRLVRGLKADGCCVMLGVPCWWREQKRDATDDPMLHQIIKQADIVSPWSVGRYRSSAEATGHGKSVWRADVQWCRDHRLEFLPVVFPGFSWHNLRGQKLDAIPRDRGRFLWSQFVAAQRAGCEMVYVAMFDEVDEGTAIFKCSNDPPVGKDAAFVDLDGLPSDFYLRVVGRAGARIRRKVPLPARPPIPGLP
jgi:hypothetical protein